MWHWRVARLGLQLLHTLGYGRDGATIPSLLGCPIPLIPGVTVFRHVGIRSTSIQVLGKSHVSIHRISGTLSIPLLHGRWIDVSLQIALLLVAHHLVWWCWETRGLVLRPIVIPHCVAW